MFVLVTSLSRTSSCLTQDIASISSQDLSRSQPVGEILTSQDVATGLCYRSFGISVFTHEPEQELVYFAHDVGMM
ncbi:hypothetical protein PGT21_007631 [Puccinia graminis f. sp. tritici]|uniref:Uncharacterized protein n=1 Tax=Puccinia graminis f. sp. tritici TaxID=56615 RepID=A0A5B0Q270_PUCGR|nr:hypothetical protein PGT21_007631 [Puccinia graminis f. sp. tritici]